MPDSHRVPLPGAGAFVPASLHALIGYLIKQGRALGGSVCNDVASGNNITAKARGYSAQPGCDAVSGWGTPDGVKLASALSSIAAQAAGAGLPPGRSDSRSL